MQKILFICHGNICRSPMAEFIFKHIAEINGTSPLFEVASAATSREEIGNDIYPPAKHILTMHGIPFNSRSARQMTKADYDYYDHIILMDGNNIRNFTRMFGEPSSKVKLLMSFTDRPGDVSDPWYSGDFETAYSDIHEGCVGLYNFLLKDAEK